MKRPAFQFYPADWRKDSALQTCSLAARGLWFELMCVMHECTPYGVLAVNCTAMTLAQITRLVGEPQAMVSKHIAELEAAGVFSRNDDGAIFSRRMVRDEHLRNVRANAGRLGGNPDLLKQKVNHVVKQDGNQNLTPSSSSSSSSSKAEASAGDACPHDAILDAYHEALPSNPRIKAWTGQRQANLRTRWREDDKRQSLDYWQRFFSHVAASPFLTGQRVGANGRPFLPGLDWLVKPENFAKVIEGRYHDGAQA